MTVDDSIHLTGPYGDDYPARVVFDDFGDDGVPASGAMQTQDEDGEWHTVKQLEPPRIATYWADYERSADEAVADAFAHLWSAA
jgi:hypothetical protein